MAIVNSDSDLNGDLDGAGEHYALLDLRILDGLVDFLATLAWRWSISWLGSMIGGCDACLVSAWLLSHVTV